MIAFRNTQNLEQRVLVATVLKAIPSSGNAHASSEHGWGAPLIADADAAQIANERTGTQGEGGFSSWPS